MLRSKKRIVVWILGIVFAFILGLYFAAEPISTSVITSRVKGIIEDHPQIASSVASACKTVKLSRQCKAYIEADLDALSDEKAIGLVKELTTELESQGWGIYKQDPGDSIGDIVATEYYRYGNNKKGCSFLVNTRPPSDVMFVRVECVAEGFPRQLMLVDLF